ncbi:MAG: hypothetical protein HY247_07340 [archaeon]|nr:MAG: hypothetical protein HY247_07340 [archaeon]
MTAVGIQVPEDRLSKEEYVKLPDYEKEHYLKNLIKRTVEANYPNGITTKQIKNALEIDPRILDKHLSIMVKTGEIYTFNYDRTTVYFPNTRALHAVLERKLEIDADTEFMTYQLRNRLGDFVYVQRKKRKGYTEDVDTGIMIPADKFPDFVEYLKDCLNEMLKRK